MWRFFRALGYLFTGRFVTAYHTLMSNRYVMEATYDKSIQKGQDRFVTVKDAVAGLMQIKIQKTATVKEVTEEVTKLSNIKLGASNKAKQRAQAVVNAAKAEGLTDPAAIKARVEADAEYIKHTAAFNDASSTLTEKSKRLAELEADIAGRDKQIATYKAELQQMQRSNEKLKEEKHEAIADVAIAQQMDAVNSVLAGLAEDSTDKDLQAAREARQKAQAKAQISSELVGNDARLAESEYLDFANTVQANTELAGILDLDNMIGTPETTAPAKLPE